ncbi:MAG TPA: hypothetical protein VF950_30765 [Planctomycetota bacterium]
MDLSVGALMLSMLIGAVGAGLFIYGKKQTRIPQLVAGLALMAYPYFVSNLWLMGGIAVALVAALWGAVKAGY